MDDISERIAALEKQVGGLVQQIAALELRLASLSTQPPPGWWEPRPWCPQRHAIWWEQLRVTSTPNTQNT